MNKVIFLLLLGGMLLFNACTSLNKSESIEGYWLGNARHNGQECTFGIRFFNDSTGMATDLIIPEYGWTFTFGDVDIGQDSIIIGRWKIYHDKRENKISGILPRGLVPKYDIEFELSRLEAPEVKENIFIPSTRQPDKIIDLETSLWAGLAGDSSSLYIGNLAGRFFCIDPNSGSKVWTFQTEGAIRGQALVREGLSYFYTDDGLLYKLSREGMPIWKYDTRLDSAERDIEHQYDYYTASPLLQDDQVYFGSGQGRLYALNNINGKEIWQFESSGPIRTTPIIQDQQLFFGSFDGKFYSIDKDTGQENWNYDTQFPITGGAVWFDNKIIFGSRSYDLIALNSGNGSVDWTYYYWFSWIESSPVLFEEVIYIGSSDSQKMNAIDPSDGQLIWEFDTGGAPWAAPLVTDQHVFVSTVGNENYFTPHYAYLICLDRLSGKEIWRFSLDKEEGGYYGFTGAPTRIGKMLWVASTSGKIYGFEVEI